MRGRFTFLAILAIAAALFAADQSLAAVATGPSNYFTVGDSKSLFTTGGAIPHQITGARDTTSATIEDVIYTFCVQEDVFLLPPQRAYVESYDTVTKGGYQDYYLTGYAAWLYTKALDAIRAGQYNSGSEITYGVGGDLSAFGDDQFRAIQVGIWAGMVKKKNDADIVDGPPGTAGIARCELVGGPQSQLKYLDCWTLDSCKEWAGILTDLGLSYEDFLKKVDAADHNNVGGVRVARLGDEGKSYDVQDHLLLIEDPPAVPEPATLAIWSLLGLFGCVAQRRKPHRPRAA
ncbi:MAG: hypothetical protein ACOX1P_33050 [Thermoguttaceae bacterium]